MELREPEWTAENMNRRQGDTTFKICGWCEFAGCGSCRYDCHMSATCDLMKSYGDNRDVEWDTPCRVIRLGQADINSIIASKKCEIEDSRRELEDLEKQIQVLRKDKRIPRSKKPAHPDSRFANYFKPKDIVWVFHKNKWNRGVVVPGYRSGDGFVSYVLDAYPSSVKGWGCGTGVPCVFLDWEYKYFRNNIIEFAEYMHLCDRTYNGEKLGVIDYIKAMKKERKNAK